MPTDATPRRDDGSNLLTDDDLLYLSAQARAREDGLAPLSPVHHPAAVVAWSRLEQHLYGLYRRRPAPPAAEGGGEDG